VSQETASRLKTGEGAAKVSIATMVVLASGKYAASIASGSIALMADAINSFSDIFSSLAVWAGLRLSQREPTEQFPYGYYKAETLAMLVVSIVIVISGAEILRESIRKSSSVTAGTDLGLIALVASFLSAFVLLLLARFKAERGRMAGSQSLVSDGKHTMVDVYSSSLVFVGILLSRIGMPWAEPVAGIIVAVYVMAQGVLSGKDAVLVLMDVAVPRSKIARITELVRGVPGIRGVESIKMRRSGPLVFGEMEVEVEGKVTVERTHSLSQLIDAKLKEEFPDIEAVTIHFEPSKKKSIRLGVPVEEDRGLESKVFPHFGRAPMFIILEVSEGDVTPAGTLKNPGFEAQKGKGIKAARALVQNKVDALVAKAVGEGPFYTLQDGLVDIYLAPDEATAAEVVADLSADKLERITTPEEETAHHD